MTEGVYDLSDPVDTAEYEAWLDSQLDGASEMELAAACQKYFFDTLGPRS